jgi:hypothetical protein
VKVMSQNDMFATGDLIEIARRTNVPANSRYLYAAEGMSG